MDTLYSKSTKMLSVECRWQVVSLQEFTQPFFQFFYVFENFHDGTLRLRRVYILSCFYTQTPTAHELTVMDTYKSVSEKLG